MIMISLTLQFSSHESFQLVRTAASLGCLDKLITELEVLFPLIVYLLKGSLVQITAQGQGVLPLRQVGLKNTLVLFASTFFFLRLRNKPSS